MTDNKQKKLVIIVEDEPALSEAIKIALQSSPYTVVSFPNGEKAIEFLGKNKVDLLLLDLLLPRISGFEVLEFVRSTKNNATIPVLIVTNYSDPTAKQRAHNLGATSYIVKTDIRIKDISGLVDKHLQGEKS